MNIADPPLSRRLWDRVLVAMASGLSVYHQGLFLSDVLLGVGGEGGSGVGTGLGSVFESGLGSELIGFGISGRGWSVGVAGSGRGAWLWFGMVVEGESLS